MGDAQDPTTRNTLTAALRVSTLYDMYWGALDNTRFTRLKWILDMKDTLTRPEWLIMEALWAHGSLTLADIMCVLKDKMDWARTTYLTYLRKLADQGYISYHEEVGRRIYEPAMSQEECVAFESRSILDRMTNSSAKLLVNNMIQDADLTKEDRAELRALIEQLASESHTEDE